MATLKLSCKNQALEWENNSEEIIAGNIKIDKIAFEFCELWDGFTKTAVFRKDDKALLVLLDNDCICEMPPEVTQTSGIVYIGVFGVKGDQKRTTEVKGLYLAEGVVTDGETPGEPTPDIYQQILNLCTEAVETSKRVETETKELNEQSKAVLEAEEHRQRAEEDRNNNEQLREEHEINRVQAEQEREQTFEGLKAETENAINQVDGLLTWGSNGVNGFIKNSQQTLENFESTAGTALAGFNSDREYLINEFNGKSSEALEDFATQSAEELEKVQTATENANEATGKADNAVDTMNNTFANALKGNVKGEIVSITDITPIEHNLGVKLSSVNLLDVDAMVNSEFVKNEDGSFTFTKKDSQNKRYTKMVSIYIPANTTVTLSVDKYEGVSREIGIQFLDVNGSYVSNNAFNGTTKYKTFKHSADIVQLRLYYSQDIPNDTSTILNGIQLKKGNSVKPYTHYVDVSTIVLKRYGADETDNLQEYTPNADGTVEGVKSIYPNMTLVPSEQGVSVEAEYNKDTNKVIESLVNAIISLGGNV